MCKKSAKNAKQIVLKVQVFHIQIKQANFGKLHISTFHHTSLNTLRDTRPNDSLAYILSVPLNQSWNLVITFVWMCEQVLAAKSIPISFKGLKAGRIKRLGVCSSSLSSFFLSCSLLFLISSKLFFSGINIGCHTDHIFSAQEQ